MKLCRFIPSYVLNAPTTPELSNEHFPRKSKAQKPAHSRSTDPPLLGTQPTDGPSTCRLLPVNSVRSPHSKPVVWHPHRSLRVKARNLTLRVWYQVLNGSVQGFSCYVVCISDMICVESSNDCSYKVKKLMSNHIISHKILRWLRWLSYKIYDFMTYDSWRLWIV